MNAWGVRNVEIEILEWGSKVMSLRLLRAASGIHTCGKWCASLRSGRTRERLAELTPAGKGSARSKLKRVRSLSKNFQKNRLDNLRPESKPGYFPVALVFVLLGSNRAAFGWPRGSLLPSDPPCERSKLKSASPEAER